MAGKERFLEVKGFVDDDTLEAYASTITVDRDDEIVLPDAYVPYKETFMKNPVLLQFHNYWDEPIGKIIDLSHDDYGIIMRVQFAPTEAGQKFKTLYKGGFMRAFSIGFIPKKWTSPSTYEGELYLRQFGLKKENVRRIYTEIELLEVSCVPVPANRDAVVLSAKSFCFNNPDELEVILEELKSMKEELQFKSVVPYKKYPLDKNSSWDGDEARSQFAKYASSDGSGDKDTINWSKYKLGFAWIDPKIDSDNFGAYKYPHHYVKDGKIVTVWSGVVTAMRYLLANKSELGDDAKAVYNHLAKHYKDFDEEPPDFEKEWTDEEIKEYFERCNMNKEKEKKEGVTEEPEKKDENLDTPVDKGEAGEEQKEGKENEQKEEKETDVQALIEKLADTLAAKLESVFEDAVSDLTSQVELAIDEMEKTFQKEVQALQKAFVDNKQEKNQEEEFLKMIFDELKDLKK